MSNKNKRNLKISTKQNTPIKSTVSKQNKNYYFNLIAAGIICLLGIFIYSNSFDCGFHFDDVPNIVDNNNIRNLSIIKLWSYNQNRFMGNLSFALNYHFGELNVWGYHLVNLFIHLINSLLIYWITLLIFSTPAMKNLQVSKNKNILALIVALMFVSHPLATQSVTYIVQRLASLVTMFYLLSAILYVKGRMVNQNNFSKYLFFGGSIITALFAMTTKENAFSLPFSIILFEMCFLQPQNKFANLKNHRFIISACAIFIFTILLFSEYAATIITPIQPSKITDFKTITSNNYLLTQFSVIVKYIQLLILPINQHLDYDFPISNSFLNLNTLLSFLFLCFLLFLAVFFFQKNRIISFGILWFFITLAIESSIVPIADVIFEHRTYLPSLGFFLILSYGIFHLLWNKYKTLAIVLLIIIIGSNSVASFSRNKIWKDNFTLLKDEVEKSPKKARPHYNLGLIYTDNKIYDTAITEYNKAINLQPGFAEGYCNRGIAYQKINNFKLAMNDYNKSIKINSGLVQGYYNRGNINGMMNNNSIAMVDLNEAIKLDPYYYLALSERGNIYYRLKNYQNALNDLNRTIQLKSDYDVAYCNRGNVYTDLKIYDKAIADYNSAVKYNPEFTTAYYNKANVYFALKKYDLAIIDYNMVLQQNPSFAAGYFYLGASFFYLGNLKAACPNWQKALSMGYQPAADLITRYCH